MTQVCPTCGRSFRADNELTKTEKRVFERAIQGLTNREIAEELFITIASVKAHLTRIYRKAGVKTRSQLIYGHASKTLACVPVN